MGCVRVNKTLQGDYVKRNITLGEKKAFQKFTWPVLTTEKATSKTVHFQGNVHSVSENVTHTQYSEEIGT